ncbi:S-layer family protein [Candidatus Saccharibacteria bacterium]|nr:S-layer family protein [Candidatus Saccharibacteria bacterium]
MGVFALNHPVSAVAGINDHLNFQGRLYNSQGAIVPDGNYNLQFKIYQDGAGTAAGNPGGTLKWTENWLNSGSNGISIRNGYLSVELGSVTAFGSSIDWNQDTLWLSVNIGNTSSCTITTSFNADCGGDGEMVPMKRMSSSPYALNSGKLGGLTSTQFIQLAQGVQTDASSNTTSVYLNKTGGGNFMQLQSSGTDVFTVSNSGDIALGSNSDHTISVATAGAGTGGNDLTVGAGAGGSGTGSAGGDLVLQGGAAGGTNGTGGNVVINAGAKTGTGADGTISIGTSNTSTITLGTDTLLAANKNLTFAAGSGNFDQSASSGTLKTGTGAVSLNGDTTVASGKNFSTAKGTDYSTVGSTNNVALSGALIRLTGASAQTITGISAGTAASDGRRLTLVNSASQAAILSNNSGSSSAGNQIITGTGSDLTLPAGASVELVYDWSGSAATSFWRVNGSVATSGGYANTSLSNLGSTNINAALNSTGADLTLQTTTSGNINLAPAGTINLNSDVSVASGKNLTVTSGTTSLTGTTNINTSGTANSSIGNATGTLGLTGSTVTISGTTNINTSGTAATSIGNGTGTLQLSSNTFNLSTAGAITGTTGITMASGNFMQNGSGTFATGTGTVSLNGNTDIASSASFATKAGSAFTTPGTSTNAALATASYYLLNTSGAAQVIQGITVGRDGQFLTLTNINGLSVTLANNNVSATGSKIITGTGGDISLPTGASIQLVYDSTNSLWRVVSTAATSGGYANTTLSNLGSTNINSALNTTAGDLTLQTTTSGNVNISPAGTINLNSDVSVAANKNITFAAGTGSFDQSASSGTFKTGTGAVSLNGDTTVASGKNFTVTNGTTNITGTTNINTSGTANTNIGNNTGTVGITGSAINASSSTINLGVATSATTLQAVAQTTSNTQGSGLTMQGATGNGSGAGGTVTVQGGTGGATNAAGGNLYLSGGAPTGTSTSTGLVVINTPTFSTTANDANCYTGGSLVANSCTIAATSINGSGAIIVGFNATGKTVTMPDPSVSTAGRVVYITAANGSQDFTLSVNGGGTGNTIAMRQNTTATMIWNGADWTAAGASSSTTLQSAYDNTLQSAGGAELVVSSTSNTNGLTIRDSTVSPVNGTLLSVQTSSAAGLFQVNSNVTEYASDAGAEVGGGSGGVADNTYPASTWSALTGTTISRYTTAGNYIATGQGSVSATTTAVANTGVKNQLSSALTANMHYNISFTTRISSGNFTDMNVYYSIDGTAASVACTNTAKSVTSVWTKVNCAFTAPSSGITASNAVLIRQTAATARTFYVDNLSVTIAADYNYATDGTVNDNTNFATNWTSTGTGSTVTRNTSDGQEASDSAQAVITAGGTYRGVRNKLSINPLTSTLYRVSAYAKQTSGSAFDDFTVRYSRDGGTSFTDCVDYNTQSVGNSWVQITCYFTTSGTAASDPYVYFTAAASSARTFLVDTFAITLASNSTPNVQIGGGVNGGPTTLFTLDKGASAPIAANNDALLGSMYYDTTLGKLQCYEADGWGACGSSPDNIITISPEYTNAVLHGTGIGTMTSDLCSDYLDINDGSSSQPTICGSNETYNFYKWTSPQATSQYYSVYVTYQLPSTFKSFNSGQTSLMGRTDSTNSSVTYQVYRNDGSGLAPCGGSISVSTGVQASWQTATATGSADPSTCSFTASSSIVFKITVMASQNANAYVGNLNFAFSNK